MEIVIINELLMIKTSQMLDYTKNQPGKIRPRLAVNYIFTMLVI